VGAEDVMVRSYGARYGTSRAAETRGSGVGVGLSAHGFCLQARSA